MKQTGRPRTKGFAVGDKLQHVRIVGAYEVPRKDGGVREYYECVCDCGRSMRVGKFGLIKNPDVKCRSCAGKEAAVTRGCDGRESTPEHRAWCAMRQRCNNPNAQAYANYGGRGITVCDRWLIFDAFLEDMGKKPTPEHQLERIDNNAGYSPENCTWATRIEQQNNRRTTRYMTANGETLPCAEWARRLGTTVPTIANRVTKSGWSEQDACTIPVDKRKANRKKYH